MTKRALLVALALGFAVQASAGIALFADGRSMKVESYRVDEDVVRLNLKGGGSMQLPIERLDRIVDDEVTTPEVVAEVKKAAEEGVFPRRSWRYTDSSRPLFKSKYNDIIIAAAKHFDVDAALVSAVIKAESDYDARTVSHKGARGLMQLMPATARRFGVTNSFDPEANIFGGVRYLRWLLRTFEGDADLAVAAYNAGEGNVWKYNGVPPFRETINYINRIAKHIRGRQTPPSVGTGEAPVLHDYATVGSATTGS